MNTYSIKHSDINKNWYIVDASGKTLGRLATQIAHVLRGKNKVDYTPHMDMGDFVVVVNAEKINVSGNKESDKTYFKHSGYIGSTTFTKFDQMRRSHPERIVEKAVWGMLPKNRLGRAIFKHLKVYTGPSHPHEAQKPKELAF